MNKTLKVMTSAALLAGITTPVAVTSVDAATTYGSLATPSVATNGADVSQDLGTITINIDTLETRAGGHVALVELPTDFDVTNGGFNPVLQVLKTETAAKADFAGSQIVTKTGVYTLDATGAAGAFAPAGADATLKDNEFKLIVTNAVAATDLLLGVQLPNVLVPNDAEGDINASVTSLGGQIVSGSVVVGKATYNGSISVAVTDDATLTATGGTLKFTVTESTAGAVKKGKADAIKLTLPKGFKWNTAGATATRINDGTNLLTIGGGNNWSFTGNNDKTLYIARGNDALGKSVFRFEVPVTVDEEEAQFGDAVVTVGGASNVTTNELKVGAYKEFGVTVEAKDLQTVKSGRQNAEIGDLKLKENIANSIYGGRTVILELPAGVKWNSIGGTNVTGSVTVTSTTAVGTDGRKIKLTIANTGASKGSIELKDPTVDIAPDFKGDVTVKVSGTAGIEGEYKLGDVVPVVDVTSDKADIQIGVQNQKAGDITIKESKEDSIKTRDLVGSQASITLTLPSGAVFSKYPTVSVTEGDVEFDLKAMSGIDTGVITIPVKSRSSKAATIKVSDVYYTVNRTVPEGELKVEVGGTAIDEVNDNSVVKARAFYTVPANNQLFPQNPYVAKTANATTITPAPGNVAAEEVQFTIGSTTYTVGDKEKTMDVAPFVEAGRTYMPIRYVADAVGADSILWDQASQTATVLKGDRVVQLKAGSKSLTINGASITMDAAAKVKDGRTVLPIRFVGQALGAKVDYNEADQTVTVK